MIERARGRFGARGAGDALVLEGGERFGDLRQEFVRVVTGVVHQALEEVAGELGRLLDLPVPLRKPAGLALGQVAVLAELRRMRWTPMRYGTNGAVTEPVGATHSRFISGRPPARSCATWP